MDGKDSLYQLTFFGTSGFFNSLVDRGLILSIKSASPAAEGCSVDNALQLAPFGFGAILVVRVRSIRQLRAPEPVIDGWLASVVLRFQSWQQPANLTRLTFVVRRF